MTFVTFIAYKRIPVKGGPRSVLSFQVSSILLKKGTLLGFRSVSLITYFLTSNKPLKASDFSLIKMGIFPD